ncbi:hypothetical protein LTR08_008632 [Meristemomyces frigidus]|nr:hypothetical protein LTR08_008632 [Meristemomyces frigidus]
MPPKDAPLYGAKPPRKLAGGTAISSSTTLAFTSQLASLINASSSTTTPPTTSSRQRAKKADIFTTHNRNTAKRAKRDLADAPALAAQKHTTNGAALDKGLWERSKRKMEAKARLYAAMKRGDVEDAEEKYAVDFDRKWAEREEAAGGEDSEQDDDEECEGEGEGEEEVQYTDEFGRTRTGPPAEAARAERLKGGYPASAGGDGGDDRFTAHPALPATIIHGDTIQHQSFAPQAAAAAQMHALAQKRDRSLTPPREGHYDAGAEVRSKGTGFYGFSGERGERAGQMAALGGERGETVRIRGERGREREERARVIGERRAEIGRRRGKRGAEAFLDGLGEELGGAGAETAGEGGGGGGGEEGMLERIERAVQREREEG